ncbi:hypothetical protein UCRPC4_g01381 [Phaeomoniella chlamydospora]|uniref:BTB domain transcription factor n=1 Tax=Phaeomoniella chlamydospora TaxID=158046 RepID=A0A0G2HEM5_PHACM|nr:hypothetical protein UCRPC4_g01381 [Phaeomoniella chlamydospora]
MPATRSSARLAANQGSSPTSSSNTAAGTKRKTETGSSPAAKRGKKSDEKEQKTLEETIENGHGEDKVTEAETNGAVAPAEKSGEQPTNDTVNDSAKEVSNGDKESKEDVEMKDVEQNVEPESKVEEITKEPPNAEESTTATESKVEEPKAREIQKGELKVEEPKAEQPEVEQPKIEVSKAEDATKEPPKEEESEHKDSKLEEHQHAANGDTAEEPNAREGITPSSILEKGTIYFFFRGRVGIDEPKDVNDIARSYIIVRPLEHDAKLTEGPIGDTGNNRLFALPKKVLPLSGKDRFMTFVEKAKVSFQELKDEFLSASDYETKTAGTRHTPAATPVGEGVYAITTTGRESHLAYILTLPSELGEVQKEIGLQERGSFIISTKNPDYPGPANAQLPQGPDYPSEIKQEFRSLRWMPTKPHHLDYSATQFLLIGESSGLSKATEPQKEDQYQSEPLEEMEKLEDEDTHRMQDLKGDDSEVIFKDLEARAKDYNKLQKEF